MITKKDFEALADELRPALTVEHVAADGARTMGPQAIIEALCRFGAAQNPRFDPKRFIARLTTTEGCAAGHHKGQECAACGEYTKPAFYQHLRAPNDPNGNPQRLYMVFDARGVVLRVVDEGYRGLPPELRDVPELPTIEIPRAEYHTIKKMFAGKGD